MRGLLAAGALVLQVGACSLLVPGTLGPVGCEDEGALGPPACAPGQRCKQGSCVEGAPDDLGTICQMDRDCGPQLTCLDPLAIGGQGEKRCTKPCCSSFDCDPRGDFVCVPHPGGGGSFCQMAKDVKRGETGELAAGETCAGPADCRSGLCISALCEDVCCTDTNCAASGLSCVASVIEIGAAVTPSWVCGSPVGAAGYFEPCSVAGDCVTSLCADVAGTLRCVTPCCSSSDCAPATNAVGEVVSVGCRWIEHEGVTMAACAYPFAPGGSGVTGASCAGASECLSGSCVDVGDAVICTDTCCSDASCGDPALFACRPAEIAGLVGLRCQPR